MVGASHIGFNYPAAHYLWWWFATDKEFVEGFQRSLRQPLLARFLSKYGVARTIHGDGPERLDFFIQRLEDLRHITITRANVSSKVTAFAEDLRKNYNPERKCESAASKALWMLRGHPVAVMDNLARAGLENLHGKKKLHTYSEFYDAWWQAYEGNLESIKAAQRWLKNCSFAKRLLFHKITSQNELMLVIDADYFANRIFDQWLMMRAETSAGLKARFMADVARLIGPDETWN